MGSDGSGLSLAGCGFYGHFLAEIAFFEGLQDWFGDEFDLLEPVCAVLLRCGGVVGCMNLARDGGCGSGGEAAEEKAAAVWLWCFAGRHVTPVTRRWEFAFRRQGTPSPSPGVFWR